MNDISTAANPASLPIAIIGAGPVGLAAAAQFIQRGLPVAIFEASASVGGNLQNYRHVRLFSPWQYNIDPSAAALLAGTGWLRPDAADLPTAGELVDDYLLPLSRLPAIDAKLRLNSRVLAVSRLGFDKVKTRGREAAPFVLRVAGPAGESEIQARAVIDASGTWSQPNPLGAHGLPALGEHAFAERIDYGMPDVLGEQRGRYAGIKVLVVGAGHSAIGNLINLATLAEQEEQTRIVWALRGHELGKLFGGGENDGLAARGALGQRLRQLLERGRLELHQGFQVHSIGELNGGMRVMPLDAGLAPIDGIDRIIAATGARPDLSLTAELRTRHDAWLESTELLAPLIDPNEHSCGTVRPHGHRELAHPEPGFYAIGAKSYGRAPNFLMATGYEQARSVAAALAGDLAAADEVRLELPQTGVCSSRPAGAAKAAAAPCCGTSAAVAAAPSRCGPAAARASCCG
ncbi:NAD(P)-binding protein [Roseateles oligotrophus]|uniref:NAD(P)-binding protein n=1 Tax=Roseateles oligotrophus TaxID=1769250 RepID=A0ABT2YDV0_9BURK|nr:NAD(P)-binding protein [Roseateles oligotrophus]MCV2368228.1 NAD(P)-binding protein [Roseateles oligotrophus]